MTEISVPKNGLWSEVKKHFISVLIGAVVVGVPFYFKSMAVDDKQSQDISELQTTFKQISNNISDINMKMTISAMQPSIVKEQVDGVKEDMRGISKRQDEMYNLLLQVAKNK